MTGQPLPPHEALHRWKAVAQRVETTEPQPLSSDDLRLLELLSFQMDPTSLAERLAALLRALGAVADADRAELAEVLGLAAWLADLVAEMATESQRIEQRLQMHAAAARSG